MKKREGPIQKHTHIDNKKMEKQMQIIKTRFVLSHVYTHKRRRNKEIEREEE